MNGLEEGIIVNTIRDGSSLLPYFPHLSYISFLPIFLLPYKARPKWWMIFPIQLFLLVLLLLLCVILFRRLIYAFCDFEIKACLYLKWLMIFLVQLLAVIIPIVGLGAFLWWAGRDIVQDSVRLSFYLSYLCLS